MDTNSRPVAVVVDGYSSGNNLPAAFARHGVDTVHVQSTPELMTSWRPPTLSHYLTNIVHSSLQETAEQVAAYDPLCIVAGQEPGVLLADALAERLGLAANGTRLSAARRDKYRMIETLREHGVRCAEQFKSGDVDALVDWAERRAEYPVVVKPLASAGTDGVAICETPEQVRTAAAVVLSSASIFQVVNREVLIQSYLPGEEYMVDTVSREGRHYTCGIWLNRKRRVGTSILYDLATLCPADREPADDIVVYLAEVLEALGIVHGPTHAEVIVTPRGPVLVEIGARLSGALVPDLHDHCLGGNQADLTALAYVRPEDFLERYAGRRYQKRREGAMYLAANEVTGVVERIDQDVVKEIEGLATVHRLNLKAGPGSRLRPTEDLSTCTLVTHMVGDAPADIQRDLDRIRELKDRVYELRSH